MSLADVLAPPLAGAVRVSLVCGLALAGASACAPGASTPQQATANRPDSPRTGEPTGSSPHSPETAAGSVPPPAGIGRPASSQRQTFAPDRVRLLSHGGASAAVHRIDTRPDGDLELPADPGVTGWWVSGALAGEVYGSVVLAGHIDSRLRGLGFFAKLLDAAPGDRIELTGGGLGLTYVVRSNVNVDKDVLSTHAELFDRTARGRLVLLTCTGRFDRSTRHYDHNLVVTAEPVGVPTPIRR